jgi:chondroitin AC lyase
VIVKTKTEKILPAESSETTTPKWILHDQAGYFFPEGGNLKLETKTVTGSWHAVAAMYKDEPVKAGIFKLWFEHGTNPSGQSYAYCVVPKATKTRMQQMENKPSFWIVKNDVSQQAIVSTGQKWAGVAFYQAGKSEFFGGIETDQPCVVMVKSEKNGLSVSVSDPTQKLAQIKLTLKGNFQSENMNESLTNSQGNTIWTVKLPKGEEAGKSVKVELIKKR